jgi:hypothetical protein
MKARLVPVFFALSFLSAHSANAQSCAQEGLKQAAGGVISFDEHGLPKGKWRNISLGDCLMHMSLIKKSDNATETFIMGFKGAIIGESGKVLSLDGTIETLADGAGKISKVISAKVIYDLSPNGGKIKVE